VKYSTHEITRPAGEMKCSCGGFLCEVRTIVLPESEPPHHRKKRIRKKWRKRWERTEAVVRGVSARVGLMVHPSYRCEKCGRREGFYSAMGRNLIQIEPLPSGALPFIYDREREEQA
jgi:hypothetical protein